MRVSMQFDLKADPYDTDKVAVLLQFILQKITARLRDGDTLAGLCRDTPQDDSGLVRVHISTDETMPGFKWTDENIDRFLDELDRQADESS
jgi:hypothetical protein